MTGGNFTKVILGGAKVQTSLSIIDSEFTEASKTRCMRVGDHHFILNLNLSSSTSSSIDLTDTQVRGEFHLANTKWQKDSKLTLRNTEVGILNDSQETWPDNLELEGFIYTRLGGFGTDTTSDIATRDVSWFKGWLGKQKSYSTQPYEQLASVLEKQGQKGKAKDVLYAGKEREHSEATGMNWLWLTLELIFIGYGYRIYYAFFWMIGFVVVGALVFRRTEEARRNKMPYGIAYSFDMLLPIIKLRESHYKIDLAGWPRYYFYFHKVMGYILGYFLIAGLSGLTK